MLEYIEGAIKNRQSRETGNIGYTRLRKTKQTYTTIKLEQLEYFPTNLL